MKTEAIFYSETLERLTCRWCRKPRGYHQLKYVQLWLGFGGLM